MITDIDIDRLKRIFALKGQKITQMVVGGIRWENIIGVPSDLGGTEITPTAPITASGDKVNGYTLGLDYNTTNLKLTSDALNTIQDIAASSSPTFVTAKLTNLTDNFIPYHVNDSTGFADSRISQDANTTYIRGGSTATSLGSELLTNGTFDTDLSGWTAGAGWSWDSGTAKHTTGNTATLEQSFSTSNIIMYQVVVTITGRTAGSITLSFNNGQQSYAGITATGTYHILSTLTGSNKIIITPTTDFNGSMDEVSVKLLTASLPSFILKNTDNSNSGVQIRTGNSANNFYFGIDAGKNNTTGIYNSAIGYQALLSNTIGQLNLAIGYQALYSNTTGQSNSAIGYQALYSNTTGQYNSAIGRDALRSNTSGYYNSAIGRDALYSNTTGNYNSAIGYFALRSIVGQGNIGISYQAGRFNADNSEHTSGNFSNYFGYDTKASANGVTNENVFGYAAVGEGSNTFKFGNNSITKHSFPSGNIEVGGADKDVIIKNVSNKYLAFGTNDTERIRILAGGNVGIGVTAPAELLEVNGNVKALTGKFTNLTDKYIPYHQSDANGLVDTNLYFDSNKLGIGTTTLTELVNINGHVKHEGNYSFYNNFSSGWTGSGWRVDYGVTNPSTSTLEVDDLFVRGTMTVYELIINQIRATNGSLFVSSSAKIESVGISDPVVLTLQDPDGLGIAPFSEDDIIIVQRVRFDSTTIIKRLVRRVSAVSGVNITVVSDVGMPADTGNFEAGDVVVRIGNTTKTNRQGSLYLTSDDSNAPYMDVANDVASWSDWTSSDKLKVRLGRLSGITDAILGSLSDYGLYAKGGVYISSNSATAGIGLKVDDATAKLIMKQGSDTIFDFDTGTATAKISGFNFDKKYLWRLGSGTPTSSPLGGIVIGADSSESIMTIYGANSGEQVKMWSDISEWGIKGTVSGSTYFELGSNNQIAGWNFNNNYLWKLQSGTPTSSPKQGIVLNSSAPAIITYGNATSKYVKQYYTSDTDWGIEGTDNSGNKVFQLGYTNKIANWSFDTAKFSNGDVRLEASASLKGLAVSVSGSDVVKVGDFTNAVYSYNAVDLDNQPDTSTDFVVDNNTHSGYFGWITAGTDFGSTDDPSGNGYEKMQWKTHLPLNTNEVKGKTISVEFDVAEVETAYGTDKLTPVWCWIQTDLGIMALTDITPSGAVQPAGGGITFESKVITAAIPDNATSVGVYFAWYVDNSNLTFSPASVRFSNWAFKKYKDSFVEINKKGVVINQSPIANIKLGTDGAKFNIPELGCSNTLRIGNWTLTTEPYLEGDGVTLNERLLLKYKNVNKGFFSNSDGSYHTI